MGLTVGFRDGLPADRDAVLAWRDTSFPDKRGVKREPAFWEWQMLTGFAGPGRFFVAEADDGIVGHLAFVPQRYTAGTTTITAALGIEGMIHPDYRRRRIFSRLASFAAERLRADFEAAVFFQIRKPVLGGMLAGGWKPSFTLPVLLKPLSLTGIARDLVWPAALRSQPAAQTAGDVRTIEADLHQVDALLATAIPRQSRTREFLDWRYCRSPLWHYRLDGLFEGARLTAFVIHRETVLRGMRTLAIADAGGLAGGDALRRLVRQICRQARSSGTGLAAAMMSRHHPAFHQLRQSGFVPGPHRFRFVLQIFDHSLGWLAATPWSLSWGDTDHL